MDGNSAKKVPTLDRLVDTPSKTAKVPLKSKTPPQAKHASTSTNGVNQANPIKVKSTPQPIVTPQNRRTDRSKFEIELSQIVHRIMNKHFSHAREEIVQEVLREVRARLPGQRKD